MENITSETGVQYTPVQTSPDNMIMKAIEQNLDMDKLERLMDLKERYDKQQASKDFKDAFANFQASKPELVKDKTVGFETRNGGSTSYKYLPLSRIQKAIDPILGKFGLSYRWEQKEANGKIEITCIVSHREGHEERTTLSGGHDASGGKNAIQAVGSTVSYLKRYTLEAALGLSSDYDNDGASAPEKKKLPELTPGHKHWKAIIQGLKAGQTNIEDLKKRKYTISEENENKLKEELQK